MKPTAMDCISGGRLAGKLLVFLAVLWFVPMLAYGQSLITCPPSPVNICSDQLGPVCLDLPIAENDSVVISGADGATWSNGKVCFTPATAGVYQLQVKAYAQDQVESCAVTVNVGFGQPPSLVCPTEPYKVATRVRRGRSVFSWRPEMPVS